CRGNLATRPTGPGSPRPGNRRAPRGVDGITDRDGSRHVSGRTARAQSGGKPVRWLGRPSPESFRRPPTRAHHRAHLQYPHLPPAARPSEVADALVLPRLRDAESDAPGKRTGRLRGLRRTAGGRGIPRLARRDRRRNGTGTSPVGDPAGAVA
ncbi:MAG: hypothetical protein AVDCRST_MAG73-3318, partial [uncultured Thermomicrobiales bacterium]